VLYIGGSTMPAYRFAQMIAIAEHRGYARPIAMQNLYNLVQREEEREMIPLCLEAGVGLVPYSPLARGFLAGNRTREGAATERAKTDKGAENLFRDSDFDVLDRVTAIAAAHGVKPMHAALAWLLHKPVMAAPIIGVTSPAQITEAAAATAITLSAEEIASLEAPYAARP
jgi:1-deoxyxylulose-5-phosphate synthase